MRQAGIELNCDQRPLGVVSELITSTTTAQAECERAGSACAAGMLADKDADSVREAITRNLDCADVTAATARLLVRGLSIERRLPTLSMRP
ncbi:hypothetical protein [Streptomyces sp. NPDC021356]|uniref:hypothetical protein n=1 Tax=Streptomyces sp. NPDC021356 TaxID=3154900 RepID=UPI0033C029AC